jgi:hypothetical protein
MSDALIRAAFETRLNAWAAIQSPPLPLVFENITTAQAIPYARVTILKGDTENQFMDGRHRGRTGVCQVSLVLPPNTGAAKAEAIAASLDAAFPLTAHLVQGGARVVLTSPFSAGTGRNEADSYYVPVSCTYRCDTVLT